MRRKVRLSILNGESGGVRLYEADLILQEGLAEIFYESEEGKSRISIRDAEARIRRGREGNEMVIRIGEETAFSLRTPYGVLPMTVYGEEILTRNGDPFPSYELVYELRQNGLSAGRQQVFIGLTES